jgi:hypothetical protein
MFKKFTKISGASVGEKKEEIKDKDLEINELKYSIMKLMDDFLSIRSYGASRPEIMIPTRIVGKELFVEALTDLLSQKSSKDVIKVLESLKSTNNDWKSIEDKIDNIKYNPINLIEEKKINDMLDKYNEDSESLCFIIDEQFKKLTIEDIQLKYEVVESMIKKDGREILKFISNKYQNKLRESL